MPYIPHNKFIRDQIFSSIQKETKVESLENIRDVYDEALGYNFKNGKAPLSMREKDINRYLVNQIRHTHSTYEDSMHKLNHMHMGEAANYKRQKNAVLNQIGKQYPFLKQECNRQKRKVNMVKKTKSRGD